MHLVLILIQSACIARDAGAAETLLVCPRHSRYSVEVCRTLIQRLLIATGLPTPAVAGVEILYRTCVARSAAVMYSTGAVSEQYKCSPNRITESMRMAKYTDSRIPRPGVGGPKAKVTASGRTGAITTVQTAMRTTMLTAREARTNVLHALLLSQLRACVMFAQVPFMLTEGWGCKAITKTNFLYSQTVSQTVSHNDFFKFVSQTVSHHEDCCG